MANPNLGTNSPQSTTSSAISEAEPLTKLSDILAGFNFEQWEAKRKARREKLKPEYCAKYGAATLTDSEFSALETAELRLKECDDCNGFACNKVTEKYRRPRISAIDGRLKIETVLCDVWLNTAGKKQCLKAGLPMKYSARSFEDYKVTADNKEAVRLAKWFVSEPRDKGLYLYGGAGTGKTFLAALITREYVLQMKSAIFGDVPQLLTELKKTFNDPTLSSEQILDRYCRCKLLVLDDLGAGQITDWAVEILYRIINSRYNDERLTVVTSNYDLDGLAQRLIVRDSKGKVVDAFSAERIVSRLKEMCYQGFLGTKDRRG